MPTEHGEYALRGNPDVDRSGRAKLGTNVSGEFVLAADSLDLATGLKLVIIGATNKTR